MSDAPAAPLGLRILLVGCGAMGAALARGWLAGADSAPRMSRLMVADPVGLPVLGATVSRHATAAAALADSDAAPDAVVLAVKPQTMPSVLSDLRAALGTARPLVISVAAGVRLATLAQALPGCPLVRAMPNLPATVGAGVTGAVAAPDVPPPVRARAEGLLAAVGAVLWLEDETQLDAVTALSGSGPAYVFLMAEALAAGGAKLGLPPEVAAELALGTVVGAGRLLEAESDPAGLRARVTSPGGTTAAALARLMPALPDLLAEAMAAAAARARALGEG